MLDKSPNLISKGFLTGIVLVFLYGPLLAEETDNTYVWILPSGFPEPLVPDGNPMSESKVRLGRFLFYDRRLSINGQYACVSCHQQTKAFSDSLPQAIGATNELHKRNAMSLANVAYNVSLTWASTTLITLEEQITIPLFNQSPVEMGLWGKEEKIIKLIETDPEYRTQFREAFPEHTQVYTIENVVKAIAAFVRTLISGNSDYDQLVYKDDRAGMNESAWRGMRLFFSEETKCAQCHQGFNFSGAVQYKPATKVEP